MVNAIYILYILYEIEYRYIYAYHHCTIAITLLAALVPIYENWMAARSTDYGRKGT